jgi:hypothetical protein
MFIDGQWLAVPDDTIFYLVLPGDSGDIGAEPLSMWTSVQSTSRGAQSCLLGRLRFGASTNGLPRIIRTIVSRPRVGYPGLRLGQCAKEENGRGPGR